MHKAMYIIGGIGIAAGVLGTALSYMNVTQGPEPVACTMEARLCPDGSGVGREGPNCEFAACPPVGIALRETVSFGATEVTPLRVVEDSRCPADAQCVWEGTLRIEVEVDEGGRTQTRIMSPGDVIDTTFGTVSFTRAEPPAQAGTAIIPGEYRFIFVEAQ